jgi:single-stranded-DNA-specific exonuclease
MIWKYRKNIDPDIAMKLSRELAKPTKFCQFLLNRGFRTSEEIKAFTAASLKSLPLPETMPGMDSAVRLFMEARDRGDTVAIFGDYDADGLTATAVLTRTLSSLGYKVISRIPNRLHDGYGLSPQAVQDLHEKGAGLLVTVDCGVSDLEAITLANTLGLPVVITDHHQIPPTLPPAQAIINPHLGGGWEVSPLAGVGVAFMLAWAVQRGLKARGIAADVKPPLVESLALVALGTIADLAPLTGVNRTLVRNGLKFLAKSEWPSLKALKAAARLDKDAEISVRDVGFRIAPKLNAAGRMGSADPALELLITDDELKAGHLADRLEELNKSRYDGQIKLLGMAMEKLKKIDHKSRLTVVLDGESWPKGLLGLVASKISEITHKPSVLLSVENGFASGSGRSVPGFDLFTALSLTRDLCVSLGGHSEAAGLKLKEGDLEAFKEAFEEGASKQPLPATESEVTIDFEATFSDLPVLFKYFADLEPFGQNHPAPNVVLRNVKVADAMPTRSNGDKHMILRVMEGANTVSLVGFNMAEKLAEVEPLVDIVFCYDASISNYRIPGWRLVDFKTAGTSTNPW